jgi:hypothetical protein
MATFNHWPPLLPLRICKKKSTPSPSLTIQHPKKGFKNKINPLPLPSPFNIFLKKNPDPPTHSTMKTKKFEKKHGPFASSFHMSNEGEK